MHVTLFGVILFLHITVAILSFMIAGVLHVALNTTARVRTIAEARSWSSVTHRLEPLLPFGALLLLGFGAWLIHLRSARLAWSDGWILTSVIALVLVEAVMGALVAPRSKALAAAIHDAPDGPVPDDIRRASTDPVVWHFAHVASFGFTGVVFLMAAKPDGVWSVVIVVVAALIGVAVSQLQLRALSAATAGAPGRRAETAETV